MLCLSCWPCFACFAEHALPSPAGHVLPGLVSMLCLLLLGTFHLPSYSLWSLSCSGALHTHLTGTHVFPWLRLSGTDWAVCLIRSLLNLDEHKL